MSGIERAGGRDARHAAAGHFEAYVGLAEKAGVELRYVLELVEAGDLSPLFDKTTGKLIYRGADPVKRLENIALRMAHRPS